MVSRKCGVGLLPIAFYLMSASWSTIAIAAEQNPLAVQDGAPAAAPQPQAGQASAQDAPQATAQPGAQASGNTPPARPRNGLYKGIRQECIQFQHCLNTKGYDPIDGSVRIAPTTPKIVGHVVANTKSADFADDLRIRGIHLSSTSSYRLDGGLAIANNSWRPTDDIQTVQVLKGAAALFYGIAAPGGVVNYAHEKADGRPLYSCISSAHELRPSCRRTRLEPKFGENDQISVHINLAATDFQTFVPGVDGLANSGQSPSIGNPR